MGMNIKNDEAHAMARELADLNDTTVTEAVTSALREALARQREHGQSRGERVTAIVERMRRQLADSPGPSLREVNDVLYDDRGLPR